MQTRVTPQLMSEARRWALRWACEHCAHFDRAASVCGNGWPTDEHRAELLRDGGEIAFCKEFEG